MHHLGEEMRQPVWLVQPEAFAVLIERDQHKIHVGLIHLAFRGRAELVDGDYLAHDECP
ncbi:hypothetical protein [Rhizobium herbae]